MANLREARVSMSSGVQRVEFRLPVDPTISRGFLLRTLYEALRMGSAVHDADSAEPLIAGDTGTTGGGDPDLDPDPKARTSLVNSPVGAFVTQGVGTTGGGDPDLDPDPTR